jgi:lipopolysaccharide biosynthesis glycosyltransferase
MDVETVRLFVGWDDREAVAYHVFCQSVLEKATVPVCFHPINVRGFDGQRDGANAFIFSRYLVPYLCDYKGWAIFMDGDMICNADIAELWKLRDSMMGQAVGVVKHDYETKHPRKYIGTKMESVNVDYPRKNWSSVVLWNCAHYGNRRIDPAFIGSSDPVSLHRFAWLEDSAIGELPQDWNHLVNEDPPGPAKLYHFTLGVPGIPHYADDTASWHWHVALQNSLKCAGENATVMVKRSEERVGEL